MEEVAGRAWLCYLALPRDAWGNPPDMRALERDHGLGQAALGRLFRAERGSSTRSMPKVAQALRSTVDYLYYGKGTAPILFGKWIPRPNSKAAKSGERTACIPEVEEVIDDVGRTKLHPAAIARVREFGAILRCNDRDLIRKALLFAQRRVESEERGEVSDELPPPLPPRKAMVRLRR